MYEDVSGNFGNTAQDGTGWLFKNGDTGINDPLIQVKESIDMTATGTVAGRDRVHVYGYFVEDK